MSDLKKRAEEVMPGGVNSSVRAFHYVGGDPIFAKSANGAYIETFDGRRLIDFCMSFGPLILGHAHPGVVEAIQRASERGTSFAVTTEAEIAMAELIRDAVPSMERIRLVNSGTEACMTAIRLARGYTGRNKILKFSGCYHGHSDGLLVKAGSGVAGIAAASSAGVPDKIAEQTVVARFNNPEDVSRMIADEGADLAAIIVEPIAANMGLVEPNDGFLEFLRQKSDECGACLIFDEVITGFRFTFGGYQNICGTRPDITCLGKIIGGGLPIGALGGRADIMDCLAPAGPVYQAGTLSGNPISVASGLATLTELKSNPPYERLEKGTTDLVRAMTQTAEDTGVDVRIPHIGSLFAPLFTDRSVKYFEDVETTDQNKFSEAFRLLLDNGIYFPPSPFEVCFLSSAHHDSILDDAVEGWNRTLKGLTLS